MEKSEIQENNPTDFDPARQKPLQKVGAFIKEARLGRGITIEDLAKDLRISKEQLTALELGEEKDLPEKVFVKAMVRRISEKLSLDTKFILDELNGRDKVRVNIQQPKSKNMFFKDKKNYLIFIILTSSLLGIGASICVINYFNSEKNTVIETSQIVPNYFS